KIFLPVKLGLILIIYMVFNSIYLCIHSVREWHQIKDQWLWKYYYKISNENPTKGGNNK
ncbi:hypothetical protein HMPREF9148_01776, partial [Prevotella sp. F0091]